MSKEYIVHLLNSYKTMLMNNKSEKKVKLPNEKKTIVRPDAVNGRFQPFSIFDLYIRRETIKMVLFGNLNYSAILATLQITSYALGV